MTRHAGFTLIELMVVVAIVAILAAVAVPAYNDQVRKGRRAAAIAATGELQLALERWRSDRTSYANTATPSTNYPAAPTVGYYAITIVSPSPTGYSIEATPSGGQASDGCGKLTLTLANGVVSKISATGTNCWQ